MRMMKVSGLVFRAVRSFARTVRFPALAAAGLLQVVAGPVLAWDGAITGTVSSIEITGGGNQGFRVYLSGTAVMCTGGTGWAYLNDTDSNYKTYTAALLMAKAVGSTVIIYSNVENGFCHIGYVSIL